MEKITEEELEKLESLLHRASPQPWRYMAGIFADRGEIIAANYDCVSSDGGLYEDSIARRDGELIQAAVNALPKLLAEIKAARGIK